MALDLACQLPEETLAALIGLGQRFLGQREIEALLEGLMATNIGEMLIERGIVQGKRDGIIKILAHNMGPIPPALREQLLRIDDAEQLDALVDAALTATSLEDFARALE